MIDLDKWKYTEEFTGKEFAALMRGIDPHELEGGPGNEIRPLLKVIKAHYETAKNIVEFLSADAALFLNDDIENANYFGLFSVKLASVMRNVKGSIAMASSSGWFTSSDAEFDNQMFSRNEINKWLRRNNYGSKYEFVAAEELVESEPPSIWPWGKHTTPELESLKAAAFKFWVNYDPTDESTAPKHKNIIPWLKNERKMPGYIARAIAVMLRPEGIKPGPR